MAKTTPYHLDTNARDRLKRELKEENQRIKEACYQLTQIDPEAEPNRYEALVCAMIGALDRQVVLDSAAPASPTAAQAVDLFDGIGVEPGALNALIAQLRNLSKGQEESSNRFQVLNDYISNQRARHVEDASSNATSNAINWEDLAKRMDALRNRLYRETEEDRAQLRQQRHIGGAVTSGVSPAPSSDGH